MRNGKVIPLIRLTSPPTKKILVVGGIFCIVSDIFFSFFHLGNFFPCSVFLAAAHALTLSPSRIMVLPLHIKSGSDMPKIHGSLTHCSKKIVNLHISSVMFPDGLVAVGGSVGQTLHVRHGHLGRDYARSIPRIIIS